VPRFGVPQIVAAVSAAGSVLDAGCGSARLTLAFAEAGAADVVGIDTSLERLAQGRARLSAHPTGARVKLIEADFDHALPFADGRFAAAASRLALMIATDPVATLRELRRVTAAGGRIVTALWAPANENPWFALPAPPPLQSSAPSAPTTRAPSVASAAPTRQRTSIAPPGSRTCEPRRCGKRSRSGTRPTTGAG
jgi:SAM-dependent methyltransferase